jgi:hypothetical protein
MMKLNLFIYTILFIFVVEKLNAKTHVSYESNDRNRNWPDPSRFVPNLPGGISIASEEKFTQVKQLLEQLNIRVIEIKNLYSQVVSGFLYYVEGVFHFPDEPKPHECRIKLWSQPWLMTSLKITYKQCDINPHTSESIMTGQTKKVDLNDYDEVMRALQSLLAVGIRLENKLKIKSINKQFVSGNKYTFESVFKNKSGKTQSCTIEVLNRSSSSDQTQKNKLIKNTCSDEYNYTDDSIEQLDLNDKGANNAFNSIIDELDVNNLQEITNVFRQKLKDGQVRYIIEGRFEANKICLIGVSKKDKNYTLLSQSCQ